MAAGFPGMAGIPNLGRGRRSKLQAWIREARADSPVAMWVPGTTQSGTTLQNLVNPGTHDATLNGGVTTGIAGPHPGGSQAFGYDGVNDYLSVPYSAALNPAQFTIEMWFRDPAGGAIRTLVDGRDPVSFGTNGYLLLIDSAGVINAQIRQSTGSIYTSVATAATGWNHVAWAFDGATMNLHLNGALADTDAATLTQSTAGGLKIGVRSDAAANWYGGKIGGVAVYGSPLSSDRISRHYTAGR